MAHTCHGLSGWNFNVESYSCPSGQAGITVCISAIMEISDKLSKIDTNHNIRQRSLSETEFQFCVEHIIGAVLPEPTFIACKDIGTSLDIKTIGK